MNSIESFDLWLSFFMHIYLDFWYEEVNFSKKVKNPKNFLKKLSNISLDIWNEFFNKGKDPKNFLFFSHLQESCFSDFLKELRNIPASFFFSKLPYTFKLSLL